MSWFTVWSEYLGELWPILKSYGSATIWLALLAGAVWFVPNLKVKVIAGCAFIVIIFTTIAFSIGIKQASDLCKAEQARAERAADARDAEQKRAAAADADARLAEIIDVAKSTQEQFDAYKLAHARVTACRLTPADRRGMRLPGDPADPEICRAAPAGAGADEAGSCAAYDRDAKDALADTRLALAEANMRLAASAAWYTALRKRYGAARLR